jgi:hypothetical protein
MDSGLAQKRARNDVGKADASTGHYSLKVVIPVRSVMRAGLHATGFENCPTGKSLSRVKTCPAL